MEKDITIQHYWQIIKRRKFHILIPSGVVLLIAVIIAFVLPPIYSSGATILIEAQEIPQDLVRTTVTGYIEQRLQTITQLVMSRSRLLEIIGRFGLYEDLKEQYTTEEIVEKMREDIELVPIQAEVINPNSGKPGSATIAFTLSYEGSNPKTVAQVANVLTSLYMEENLRNREEKARTTFEFLERQLEELNSEILQTESQIAGFKKQHINELPELMQLNLQTMERLQREISSLEESIKTLKNRKIYLEGQLATVEPMMYAVTIGGRRVLTPKEELEVTRSEYLSLAATHAEGHPDVVALKKKLEAMEKELAIRDDLRARYHELSDKENQLAKLSEQFSEKHPDVIKLKKEIAQLREEAKALSENQTVMKAVEDEQPENPSYINLQTQIESTQMEINNATEDLKRLRERYEDYRKRVENTPQVEQEYRILQRDYANAQTKYQETKNRLLAAKEAKGLEESRMGEKFTLIEPAIVPEMPSKPNRLAILLIGLVLAAAAGIGFGALSEYMDQSVREANELTRVSGHPVLAVIPYLETPADVARKRRKKWALAGSAVGLIIVGIIVLHYVYGPLDVLWIKFERHIHISF
jgi:succinoglycan biosynthesis transport protein ExoP